MKRPRSTPPHGNELRSRRLVVVLACALVLVAGFAAHASAAPPAGPHVLGSTWITGASEHQLALDTGSGRLFVGDDRTDLIQVVQAAGLRHVGALHVPCCNQDDLATDPGLGTLYATGGLAGMDAFPTRGTADGHPVAFKGYRLAGVMAVDAVHHLVYTIDGVEGDVVEVDGRALREVAFIPLGFITGIAVDPVTRTLFAADDLGEVWFVDLVSGRTRGPLDLRPRTDTGTPPTLAWDPVLHRLHVLVGHQVVTVDPVARTVTGRTWLPRGFYDALAIDATRHLVYAVRSWTDQSFLDRARGHELVVLDARATQVTHVVPVCRQPTDLAVDPASGRVHVACRDRLVTLTPP